MGEVTKGGTLDRREVVAALLAGRNDLPVSYTHLRAHET